MSKSESNSPFETLAAQGFYHHTDPTRPGANQGDLIDQQTEAIKQERKEKVIDKMISAYLDVPVSISSKIGDSLGRGSQWISEKVRKSETAQTIGDGLKTVDENRILNSLANAQLPGAEGFTNGVNNIMNRIENIQQAPWIGKLMAFPATFVGWSVKKIMPETWDKLVDEITCKLTKDLLTEIASILVEWYQDPKTLCCLIKNLAAIGSMVKEGDFTPEGWDQAKQQMFMGVRGEEFLGRDYFTTKEVLKKISEDLGIMIGILGLDFSQQFFADLDIGKELSDMVLGIVIATMDSLIAFGKKAWYDKVSEWFKNFDQLESQCLPLKKLIDALFRFMSSDHGLFNLIRRYILEYARYLKFRMITNFRKKYVNRLKDLEFLKFVKGIIDKILLALENFEICLEADYSIVEVDNPLSNFNMSSSLCPYGIDARLTNFWADCPYRTLNNNNIMCRVSEQVPTTNGRTSYCIHPDAISNYYSSQNYNNQGNIGKLNGVPKSRIGDKEQIAITFPTNNEVKNFLVNKLGYSGDRADQILAQAQTSTGEGKIEVNLKSLANLGVGDSSNKTMDGRTVNINKDFVDKRKELMSALGDCAKTLRPETIADLANRIRDIL